MLCTKSFIKASRSGNFLKIVREHYIRDDIYCGIHSCNLCTVSDSSLSEDFCSKSTKFEPKHFLILDTNVVLDQIDVLEESVLGNVIILHTVLKEVRHRSLPIYRRLISIVDNPSRCFYIFTNDHHKETYAKQKAGELVNDYNDRCIRLACSWYSKHLPKKKFILLTDDVQNREKAKEQKLATCSISHYIKQLKDCEFLLDKLSRNDFQSEKQGKDYFPPHLALSEIMDKLRTKSLHSGTFRASRDNFLEGQVNVEGFDEPILIQGHAHLNRAVDGDSVAVELLAEDLWSAPSEIVLEDEAVPAGGDADIDADDKAIDASEDLLKAEQRSLKKSGDKGKIRPTGRVVGVIRRKWRQYCGILQGSNDASKPTDGIYHVFAPADKKIPKVVIQTRNFETLKSQKLVVAIDSWPRNSRYPQGHFVRALGKIGDQATENEVVLLEHDIPHSQFSKEVLSCLPKLPWIITEDDEKARVDLRHLDICSVDPPGCTDIDDALHCRSIGKGKYEVGVHIADVSHFIRPGNALDKEAASRATTVYLVNKRIDMVPGLLSSNLCSLRGNEERFAFSCIWEMDNDARILNVRFNKSIICSKQAMTYEEAQIIIDDSAQEHSIAQSLRGLNKLAKILKQRRLDGGALVLASPEVKIQMDSETHEPIDVQVKKLFETNSMVEEFMLQANISVAEKILQEFPDCAMLRRHPQPQPDNFIPLKQAGKHLGFDINVDSNKQLAKSLDDAVKSENVYLNTMLRILATRCMMQAVYFSSGTVQASDYQHYGLAVPLYTHFTSPIRRFADIIVHRLLAVCIGADSTYPDLLDKHKSSDICNNLNYRNRMAQYAGRASVAFNTHLFFKDKSQKEDGFILYVKRNALQILIPKYGLECTLYLSRKDEKSIFIFNEENQTQKCGDVIFHTFDPVTIQLALNSDNIQHQRFELKLVRPYIKGFSVESDPATSVDAAESKRKIEVAPLSAVVHPSKKSKKHKKNK